MAINPRPSYFLSLESLRKPTNVADFPIGYAAGLTISAPAKVGIDPNGCLRLDLLDKSNYEGYHAATVYSPGADFYPDYLAGIPPAQLPFPEGYPASVTLDGPRAEGPFCLPVRDTYAAHAIAVAFLHDGKNPGPQSWQNTFAYGFKLNYELIKVAPVTDLTLDRVTSPITPWLTIFGGSAGRKVTNWIESGYSDKDPDSCMNLFTYIDVNGTEHNHVARFNSPYNALLAAVAFTVTPHEQQSTEPPVKVYASVPEME